MFGLFKRKKDVPEVKTYPGMTAVFRTGQPAFTERNLEGFSREGYIRNAVAFSCIKKIARSIGSVPLQVCRYGGKEKVVLDDHPLLALLERPNPKCGGAAFFESLAAYKLISGNCYVARFPETDARLNNEPVSLYLLRPDRVKILQGDSVMPSGYEYQVNESIRRFPVDMLTGASDVLHFREFHPMNDYYGLSPMEAAAYSIDTFNAVQKWNKALLDNSAMPTGGLKMNAKDGQAGTLSDEQYTRLRQQIDEQYSGAKNAGRPMLLEGGLDWVEMSHSPKDMDFIESMMQAARNVASVYGVPPQLVNIPGSETFNNVAEAKLTLWQDTVLPELDNILDELNHWLAPQYGEDIYIEYDENNISALEPRRQQRFDRANSAGFMRINEKRRMCGLDDIDGGDVLLVPTGQIPLDMVTADDAAFRQPVDDQQK